jgi:hypothetical protein
METKALLEILRDLDRGNISTEQAKEQIISSIAGVQKYTAKHIVDNCPFVESKEREAWLMGVVWLKEQL